MNDNISIDSTIAGSVELFEFNTIFNNLINVYAQLFTHKLYIDKVLCVLFSGRVYASIKSTTSSLILYIIYTCVIYLVDWWWCKVNDCHNFPPYVDNWFVCSIWFTKCNSSVGVMSPFPTFWMLNSMFLCRLLFFYLYMESVYIWYDVCVHMSMCKRTYYCSCGPFFYFVMRRCTYLSLYKQLVFYLLIELVHIFVCYFINGDKPSTFTSVFKTIPVQVL